jgi:hypothetical protein
MRTGCLPSPCQVACFQQALRVLGSFVVNASKETFPNTLARSLFFAQLDCGDCGCVCFGAAGFKTSRNCICGLQMPTKARVPGFGLVCGQCFEETFPNTLARSLSFAQLDCGDCGCVCFGAPAFQTSRNCICALEMPTRASVPAFGLVCGQCFQGNISQHIGSVTLLRRMGQRRPWLRLFWGARLQNKSKLHLWVANANESTRSGFWACLWSMLRGNISQHISSVTLLRTIGLRRLWLRLFWGTCLPNKSKLHLCVGDANESKRLSFWAALWQMLQGNISQHIGSVTLLRRIGLRRLWLRLFWGTCLPNKSKLHL